jgi:CheY-like chemotaxis protein
MRKKRVLYAEDDPANRRLLELKLERAGIECDAVGDGILALQMYADNDYDVVILDQYMPDMDGQEVATQIRKSSSDIPLIAITSDDTLKQVLLQTGFNGVIIKPLRGDNAVDLIKSYLYGGGNEDPGR